MLCYIIQSLEAVFLKLAYETTQGEAPTHDETNVCGVLKCHNLIITHVI